MGAVRAEMTADQGQPDGNGSAGRDRFGGGRFGGGRIRNAPFPALWPVYGQSARRTRAALCQGQWSGCDASPRRWPTCTPTPWQVRGGRPPDPGRAAPGPVTPRASPGPPARPLEAVFLPPGAMHGVRFPPAPPNRARQVACPGRGASGPVSSHAPGAKPCASGRLNPGAAHRARFPPTPPKPDRARQAA